MIRTKRAKGMSWVSLRVKDPTGVIDIPSVCGAVDTRRKLVATLLPMLGTLLYADEASFTEGRFRCIRRWLRPSETS